MILFPELDDDDATKLNEVIARELKVELMESETPTGGYDLDMMSDRVPPWPLLEHRDRCQKVLPALSLMAQDKFEHELSPLYAYALYRSLEAWRDVAGDHAENAESEKERHELGEYGELLEYYVSETFGDTDFLTPEIFANAVLRGTDLLDEFGVAIEDFFELLPDHIRRDIERKLATKASGTQPGPGDDTGHDRDPE